MAIGVSSFADKSRVEYMAGSADSLSIAARNFSATRTGGSFALIFGGDLAFGRGGSIYSLRLMSFICCF